MACLSADGQLGVLEVPEGILAEILHNEFDLITIAIVSVQSHRLQSTPAQVVDTEVVADAKKPRREAVFRVEPIECRPRPDERLLAEFPSEFDISDQLTEKGRQTPLIAAHEDGERIFPTIKGKPHKLFVRRFLEVHSVDMIPRSDPQTARIGTPSGSASRSASRIPQPEFSRRNG